MIIRSHEDVTEAVLGEMHRTPDARTKQLLSSLVRHLHAFVRETRLTEREFQEAIGYVNAIGQKTTPSHNEAMLMAGALGVSNLVCLMNNTQPTQANNLGPFYRAGAPRCAEGESLARSPTPGPKLRFKGWVRDLRGRPVAGAEVDVWHSSPVGLYENQDPGQAEMNLRGKFVTLEDGSFSFTSVKPAGYPVPIDGPTGALLAAQRRHNFRPAHLHFLIYKPGFKTIASQVYDPDDPHLETDSQFAVTQALIGDYRKQADGSYFLEFNFVIERGEARLPKAPITEKVAAGTRLRHIAVVVRDLERAADFYEKVFGLKRVGREDLEMGSGIYLSDGVINLALLKYKNETASGAHHFGFQVDDLEAARKRIEAAGGTFFFTLGKTQDEVNFEMKFKDPDGVIFDISEKGWLGATS
jgi:protocatechuate 3,4-dioxygenase beta subunit/catechol 2,3-dioxygenase-like lactoylglutathione lyase family enzyme